MIFYLSCASVFPTFSLAFFMWLLASYLEALLIVYRWYISMLTASNRENNLKFLVHLTYISYSLIFLCLEQVLPSTASAWTPWKPLTTTDTRFQPSFHIKTWPIGESIHTSHFPSHFPLVSLIFPPSGDYTIYKVTWIPT
jgi:hypothetical protein